MNTLEKVRTLDIERKEIELRIVIRAAVHAAKRDGISITPPGTLKIETPDGTARPLTVEDLESIAVNDVYQDAARYVEIENAQWTLLGLRDAGTHEQPPL
nr:hypothetical protein [uncultured Methanoregula sp.]